MSLFLDTGVLYAFLNADDPRHADARDLVRRAARGEWGTPVTSDYVLDELLTLVRVRTRSVELARRALRLFPLPDAAFPGLRLLSVAPHHLAPAFQHLETHWERGLSFTDATHLALMAAHDVERLATFDKGFAGVVDVVPE